MEKAESAGGGGGGNFGVEGRLARVEATVEHIQTDVADIKQDIRDVRQDIRDVRKYMRSDFRIVWGGLIALGLLGIGGFAWILGILMQLQQKLL